MSSTLFIVVAVLLAALFAIIVLAMNRSGPRVTTIETRRDDPDDDRDSA